MGVGRSAHRPMFGRYLAVLDAAERARS
jgi:hypothetical protein